MKKKRMSKKRKPARMKAAKVVLNFERSEMLYKQIDVDCDFVILPAETYIEPGLNTRLKNAWRECLK